MVSFAQDTAVTGMRGEKNKEDMVGRQHETSLGLVYTSTMCPPVTPA